MRLFRVVKEFDSVRTPCPVLGTVGVFDRRDDDLFLVVYFFKPFTDTEGSEWTPGDTGIGIKFKSNEVEEVVT